METSFAFGNIKCILETYIGYWKQKLDIGNIKKHLETSLVYWKHKFYIGNTGWYIGNNAFGNIKMKIMHIRVGMYIELGLECILGWDEIRERVLLEII